MAFADVDRIRAEMEEAEARRLQPHYVRAFFVAAFEHLGGRIVEREPGRFEIADVPAAIRAARPADRHGRAGAARATSGSPSTRTWSASTGAPLAELLAPGHPLLDGDRST